MPLDAEMQNLAQGLSLLGWGFLFSGTLASLVVLVWLGAGLWRLKRSLPRLSAAPVDPPQGSAWPRVSVVVPARDEAADVEVAILSLLEQDYPGFEVVAVDDRSVDATGAILDRLAARDPRLRVIHLTERPEDWLGKTHACQRGEAAATGEWLLFTDADVRFAPDALRGAVAVATRLGLGHLAVFPELVAPGFLERAFVTAFGLLLSLKLRPWDLQRAGTSAYVGLGAFNLVSREAWQRIGGHRTVAFEVIDDLKLGLVLRRSGIRQGAAEACGRVSIRWQRGLRASFGGLMKNAFAGTEWRWRQALSLAAALGLLALGPVGAALLAPSHWMRAPALLTVFGWMAVHGLLARKKASGSGLEGLLFPAAALALVGVLLASAIRASLSRGVSWRGTFYPLWALRERCVREGNWPTSGAVGWD